MITINIIYSAYSNTMRIDNISNTRIAGTTGDDNATHLKFHFDDVDGTLDGFGARVEFDVIVDDDPPYRPYMILDESNSIRIPNAIMSRVKYGSLPIQLAFSRVDSKTSDEVVFYSLNKLVLSVADAIMSSATEPIDIERHPDLMDAIYSVRYDETTSSFYFTQFDGSQIKVHLSDLSEEHFEVENESQLILLNNAEDGDTATTLDNGKWYKLYGVYSDINNWKLMSSFRYGYSLVNELSKIVLKDVDGKPLSEVSIDDTPTDESPNLISSDAVYQSVSTERSERQSADTTLQNNIDGKVSKSGDTMTGSISMSGGTNAYKKVTKVTMGEAYGQSVTTDGLVITDKNNESTLAHIQYGTSQTGLNDRIIIQSINHMDGTSSSAIYVNARNNGKSNVSIDTNLEASDNSNNVATTSWASQTNLLVHTYGSETISGEKTFTGKYVVKQLNPWMHVVNQDFTVGTIPTSIKNWDFRFEDSNETIVSRMNLTQRTNGYGHLRIAVVNYNDENACHLELISPASGDPYISIPSTPSGATGSTIVTADWSLGKFVKKTGDTMTGGLLIQKTSEGYPLKLEYTTYNSGLLIKRTSLPIDSEITSSTNGAKIYFQDAGDVSYAGITTQKEVGHNIISLVNYKEGVSNKSIALYTHSDGTAYATAPTPSSNTDNSTKIATTSWANQTSLLVHSYGAETIDGSKTFNSPAFFKNYKAIRIQDTNMTVGVNPESALVKRITWTDSTDKDMGIIEWKQTTSGMLGLGFNLDNGTHSSWQFGFTLDPDGTAKATAPTTPTNATGTEIATANWVNTKATTLQTNIDGKVSKSGDKMTGLLDLDSLQFTSPYGSWRFRPSGTGFPNLSIYANNDSSKQFIQMSLSSNELRLGGENNRVISNYPIENNDNTKTVATTEWANQTSLLVHSYGNETITGTKTFTSQTVIKTGSEGLAIQSTTMDKTNPTTTGYNARITFYDKNGLENDNRVGLIRQAFNNGNSAIYITAGAINSDTGVTNFQDLVICAFKDGTGYAKAPTTPTNATSNEIATANWSIGKFVNKSGDTMTGILTIAKSGGNEYLVLKRNDLPEDTEINGYWNCPRITWRDSGNNEFAYVHPAKDTASNRIFLGAVRFINGEKKYSEISAKVSPDGIAYTSAPTPSNKADNSTKIATTEWVNQSDFLVHTTGIEDVHGFKKFTNPYWNVAGLGYKDPRYGRTDVDNPLFDGTYKWLCQIPLVGKDDATITNEITLKNADNSLEKQLRMFDSENVERTVASIHLPATGGQMTMWLRNDPPSNANGQEVTTANWVNSKLAGKVTVSTSAPTSSDGNDGDIWIQY